VAGGDETALAETTEDRLLGGRIVIHQPARGMRVSLDPLLLAGFVAAPYGRFLDIGAGTGALSFLLLARDPTATGVGVELQPRLAALAVRGRDDNGWRDRLELIEGDVRSPGRLAAAGFDLVATNPPYRSPNDSRPSPDQERALAHHELTLRLPEWLDVAARAVRPGGRVAAVLPASRTRELLGQIGTRGLHLVRLRHVHPYADRPASRVLVEAERGRERPFVMELPLVVHEPGGGFTAEVARMLGQDLRAEP
jgi:tRNA1(Val) A37 N6-methylase TrmN6